jgi:hypothetical protein
LKASEEDVKERAEWVKKCDRLAAHFESGVVLEENCEEIPF